MSLVVWLPLTKDLRQQGLANTPSLSLVSGNSLVNDGKVGSQCLTLTKLQTILGNSSCMSNKKQISYAYWVKVNTAWSSNWLDGIRWISSNGSTTSVSRQEFYTNCTKIGTWFPSSSTNSISGKNFTPEVWTHLAATFDYNTGDVSFYINGVLQGHVTTLDTTYYCRGDFYIGDNGVDISMNDVRIYDHCLSPMEVKQISRGLVLHYPLNRQGWGQENLATQYVVPGSNGPLVTTTAGRTVYYGKYGITIPTTENADTYFSIYMKQALESGKKYTLSCEVNGLSNGTYYNFPLFAQNNSSMGLLKLDHNGLCSLTFTMNYTGTVATSTVDGVTLYRLFMDDISRSIASGQGAITVTNIKLEEGDKVTPWCPASIDSSYTTMGLNSTTEYDCSGFCNNGTWHGTHTNTSDTPKYAVSTTATGSGTTYLEGPVLPAEAKTVALWIKNTSKSSNGAIFNDKTSGLQIGLLNSLLYMNAAASTAGFTTTHWINGEWNHVVAVNNKGTRSLYVNGQAETQSGASNYYIHNADNCWLWNRSYNNSYPFTGSLCDLRVYATALSADDVKSLYQNCATIDPDGTIHGQIRS